MDVHKLSINFFFIFAQTECALKVLGFHYGEGDAKPNWDKFSKEIGPIFDYTNSAIKDAVEYIEQNPPKKQVIEKSKLIWVDETKNGNRLIEIFLCIRRVRNNLFHGGKFNGIYIENPERSKELIESSLKILKYCRQIYPGLVSDI